MPGDRAEVPLRCEVRVTEGFGSATYAGRVHALEAVAGTYELNLDSAGAGGSAVIRQSGEFSIPAGVTEVLGEATLGGTPGSVVAELTLNWNGQVLRCLPAREL